MKTYLFPGQGSQHKGMGKELFNKYPNMVNEANRILGYSIEELCLEDKKGRLNQTQYTQPALYVVNALSFRQKMEETGKNPDFLAGHSLGEYNALEAAHVFSFSSGLKMVKKRGDLMSKTKKGAMAAVIGATVKEIKELLNVNHLNTIDIANFNSPLQIVISGPEKDIHESEGLFKKQKIRYIILNTSGAFHSRYMSSAKDKFQNYLKRFKFHKLKIPVISNVKAIEYRRKDILKNLTDQITHSVRWTETIHYLMNQGSMEFEELGVGNVLTNLVKVTRNPSTQSDAEKISEASKHGSEKNEMKASPEEVKLKSTEVTHNDPIIQNNETFQIVNWDQGMKTPVEKIACWNRTYPVGTKVSVSGYHTELKTRTEAMLLFGHRAAIYIEGYNGYFALDEVAPV